VPHLRQLVPSEPPTGAQPDGVPTDLDDGPVEAAPQRRGAARGHERPEGREYDSAEEGPDPSPFE
jgi:hypothetical protein